MKAKQILDPSQALDRLNKIQAMRYLYNQNGACITNHVSQEDNIPIDWHDNHIEKLRKLLPIVMPKKEGQPLLGYSGPMVDIATCIDKDGKKHYLAWHLPRYVYDITNRIIEIEA